MKFLKLAVVTAISLGAFTGLAQVSAATTEGMDGRSKVYSPNVDKVKRADVAGFVIAARGQLTATNKAGEVRTLDRRSKFYANETLKTGEGSMAQLRFKDRALMTLKPESQLDIGEYHFGGAKDPENRSFLSLVSGGFRTISGAIGRANESAYRIETPAASIGIRGTDYELIISLDGKVFAAVHDGGISIVNDIGELDLGADSEYLFAEVGEGQSPLGLSEMPEIFQVSGGEKKELTPEQKEKIAKKMAEAKEKADALLANFSGGDSERDDGAIQKSVFDELVRNDDSIDTRIDPSLLDELKKNGRYALLTSEEGIGDFVEGKTLNRKGGTEKLFYGENGELLSFTRKAIRDEGVEVQSGLANVDWGRWNSASSLQADGTVKPFDKNIYWMDAEIYDQAAIAEKEGKINVSLMGFTAGTSHDNLAQIDNETATGSAILNFNTKKIDGSITMGLLDVSSVEQGVAVGDLTINFDGDMSSNNFKSDASFLANEGLGLPEGPITMKTGTKVKGTLVAPETKEGEPGLAGAFSAQLPTEVTEGVSVGVQGLFTMGNGVVIQKAAPAPFL